MKVTRRKLAEVLAMSAAYSGVARAQAPGANLAGKQDAVTDAARGEFREAGRVLGAVKLPRSTEPATRFEA